MEKYLDRSQNIESKNPKTAEEAANLQNELKKLKEANSKR